MILTLSQTSPGFYVSAAQVLKTLGKGEIAWDKQFLPFPQCSLPFPTVFSTHLENFLPFSTNLKLWSAKSFSLEEYEICCLGKGQLK